MIARSVRVLPLGAILSAAQSWNRDIWKKKAELRVKVKIFKPKSCLNATGAIQLTGCQLKWVRVSSRFSSYYYVLSDILRTQQLQVMR